jgi:hypothetical protein
MFICCTSQFCPACAGKAVTFTQVRNPRVFRLAAQPLSGAMVFSAAFNAQSFGIETYWLFIVLGQLSTSRPTGERDHKGFDADLPPRSLSTIHLIFKSRY